MINLKRLALAFIMPIAGLSVAQAENRLDPGLWRAQTSMGGRPLSEPVETCISEEGARTSNGTDDEVRKAILDETGRNGCGATEIVIDGARISFATSCQGVRAVTDILYEGTHYAGTLTTELPTGKTTLDVAGDRVGDCAVP